MRTLNDAFAFSEASRPSVVPIFPPVSFATVAGTPIQTRRPSTPTQKVRQGRNHEASVFELIEPLEYQDEDVDTEEVELRACHLGWNREDARSLREFRRGSSRGGVSVAHIPPTLGGLRCFMVFQRWIPDGVVGEAGAGGGICWDESVRRFSGD